MRAWAELAVLALLVIVGGALYWPVFDIPPFEEDNIYALAWVAAVPAVALLTVDPAIYPEWRPLAYATVWLEHAAGGSVTAHFAVNLALWIGCAWLVYRIVETLAQSRPAALLAAALVLTDPRATWALVSIIERQTTMACAFGLGALWLILRRDGDRLTGPTTAGVIALLLASALSKEYGLAFTVAVAGFGLARRRADLAVPALVVGAAYVLLRSAIAGGASAPYCEDMYFFSTRRAVCLEPLQLASFPQLAYNVAATLVNMPLLGLLSGAGEPILAEYRLVVGLLFTALAATALVRGPVAVGMIAIVPIANAFLSLMIYRDRNQLAGACALAILAGVGLRPALGLLRSRALRIAAIAAIAALLTSQAILAHALVVEERSKAKAIEPCGSAIRERPFVPPFIAAIKMRHGLADPFCLAAY